MKKTLSDKSKGTSMATQNLKFYMGSVLNPVSDDRCDYLEKGMIVTQGEIIKDILSEEKGLKKYKSLMKKSNTKVFENSVFIPGFYDMHFHWVQDDVREMPKDSLLGWLEKYTFPTETKFANKAYSYKRAREFFKKLSKTGTVGGACYSSIHEHSLDAAMKHVQGDFVIGNVLMNMNSPEQLTQSEDDSLNLTQKLIGKYGTRHAFTPRFAITTTPKVMKKGSQIADKNKCFKQTHLSETPQEIDFVLSIYRKIPGFEKVKSYTEIYEKTGMLGKRSLMGHGIHLSKAELQVLKKTQTSVIHCPTSNAPLKEKGLGSGLFDFKKVNSHKISWALGSDIGGGPFLSMFDVMRSFVDQNHKKGEKSANYVMALYRSTLAGAKILGVHKRSGSLNKNKEANFLVVPHKGGQTAEEVLEGIIAPLKGKRHLYDGVAEHVYIKGRLIS